MRFPHHRQAFPAPRRPDFHARRKVVLGLLACSLVAVLWSAGGRQLLQTDYLQDQGERRYLRDMEIPVHRGEIQDRNGELLALSAPVMSVWADPRRLTPDAALLPALANLIEIPVATLRQQLTRYSNKGFVYLQRGLSPDRAERVMQLLDRDHAGALGLEREYRRYYPSGETVAHVVGLTNIDDQGQEGMERAYDSVLTGQPGLRRVIQDGRRRVVEEVERLRHPAPGQTVRLSLDRQLQFLAYRELKRTVQQNQAQAGTAVILDVGTGEVLAMVNQPSFNPNDRATMTPAAMRNRAITDLFEPGSTLKPMAVAASLEAGKVTPNTPVDTSPGHMSVGSYQVRDIHNYGALTVTSVITKSSNVGVTKLALDLEPAYMWEIYRRLGIGQPTDSHFPGEVAGRLPHFSGWSRFEQATHSFGYGLNMTALQLARAYAILAADGVRRPLSMVRVDTPPAGEQVLSQTTAVALRRMMETVISDQGTAKKATVEGYRVAGKTGTVKKSVAGGYAAKRYLSVFAGMIPASQPRLVMVVMIDEPGGKDYYGGLVAAPMFARVMAGAMRILNVPPDAEPTPVEAPRSPSGQKETHR